MTTKTIELLGKWRQVPALQATAGTQESLMRYLRATSEKLLALRVEGSAIAALLVQKGVFSNLEFAAQVDVEAEALMAALEKEFPGFKATEYGMQLTMPDAKTTIESWHSAVGLGDVKPA